MAILALDLGGTKLAAAVFLHTGKIVDRETILLENRTGTGVGRLITGVISKYLKSHPIECIGVSVPGISRPNTGSVWAPNIDGWNDYPLLQEIRGVAGTVPVRIENDRACSILGEQWQGNARGCMNAIFIAVGTGIGAGILADGKILHGADGVSGAIGWMALPKPFHSKYASGGCFEFYASGAGIPKFTREVLNASDAASALRDLPADGLTAYHVLHAHDNGDGIASEIITECIAYWGMAAANLVSIFNPEKIIFGGGIFGPASRFIEAIKQEASQWAQPISMKQVSFEQSALASDAALTGASFLAMRDRSIL